MKKLTFLELAERVLNEETKPLLSDEIWNIARAKGYDNLINTSGKTPGRTIGAQLYVDTRDNSESKFIRVGSRPTRFFLKNLLSDEELSKLEIQLDQFDIEEQTTFKELDLHPLLSYFINTRFNVYTKTIRHTRSKKKKYAQWMHPDIVGVYFPIDEWHREVLNLGKSIGNNLAKFYSFELKKELKFSNIREAFFQAVSNSSWANEGFLVAARINEDDEFLSELKRLSNAFGIGIINLDTEDPDASDVIFPATTKQELDWDTIDKMCDNPDFTDFLNRVQKDNDGNEVRKEKYDTIQDRDDLIKKFNK